MTSVYRPASWILAVSLLLHAAAIGFLLKLHPREPLGIRQVSAGVTALHFYRAKAPTAKVRQLVARLPGVQHSHLTFRVPDRSPQPVPPQLAPILADPPSIQPAAISVTPVPRIPDLPPPRRVVAAVGVFDGAPPPVKPATHAEIATGDFGDASTAAAASRFRRASNTAISSAAEIVLKPRPAYTEEGRRLGIEGEVLLEVLFLASGEARVQRMIRGLGHGLDENAVTAARAIQFRPAQRGDTAIDSTAVVHIVFQLAH